MIPSRSDTVQHSEGCFATQFTTASGVRVGSEEKAEAVAFEISAEGVALETRK